MYYEHFGLHQPPFRITPDTRLFFQGGDRGAVFDALLYAIASGEGIIKVVGEVGSGKTMLCRMLEIGLPAHVEVVYLANPGLSPDEILRAIALDMRLPVEAGTERVRLMHSVHRELLARHAQNRQVVVFVEEAQGMPLETLEEIRLLSNLETKDFKLLQIVLFGQPELDEKLASPDIRQLRERITQSFDLTPFGAREVRDYVYFRMHAAGYRGPAVFEPPALRRITRASKGLVRRVNILADKALLAAYAQGGHRITARHVGAAVQDSEFSRSRGRGRWLLAAASVVAGLLAAGVLGPELFKSVPAPVDEDLIGMQILHRPLALKAANALGSPGAGGTRAAATQSDLGNKAERRR